MNISDSFNSGIVCSTINALIAVAVVHTNCHLSKTSLLGTDCLSYLVSTNMSIYTITASQHCHYNTWSVIIHINCTLQEYSKYTLTHKCTPLAYRTLQLSEYSIICIIQYIYLHPDRAQSIFAPSRRLKLNRGKPNGQSLLSDSVDIWQLQPIPYTEFPHRGLHGQYY